MGRGGKPGRKSRAAFAAPPILPATFLLAACAHGSIPEPPASVEEGPVIGWRCSEFVSLPDKVRAALLAPVIDGPVTDGSPTPPTYEFALYRDNDLGQTVESYASWIGAKGDLVGKNPHTLYLTIYGRPVAGDTLLFRTGDGKELRLPSDIPVTSYINSGRPEAYIKLTDSELASRLLENPIYEVFAERRSQRVHLGKLKLFSIADASSALSTMLARIETKMSDPSKYCDSVFASPATEESIIIK